MRNLQARGSSSEPAPRSVATVHCLQEPLLGRSVRRRLGGSVKRDQAQMPRTVQTPEESRGACAEAAIGVVEHLDQRALGLTVVDTRGGAVAWLRNMLLTGTMIGQRPRQVRVGIGEGARTLVRPGALGARTAWFRTQMRGRSPAPSLWGHRRGARSSRTPRRRPGFRHHPCLHAWGDNPCRTPGGYADRRRPCPRERPKRRRRPCHARSDSSGR